MNARAQAILAAASCLHVLEPADLRGHHGRAAARLTELTDAGFLDEDVIEALAAIIERKAPGLLRGEATGSVRTLSSERHRSSARRRATLSPAGERSGTDTVVLDAVEPARHLAGPRIDPDELASLPPRQRAAVAGTAFARLLIRSGGLSVDDLPAIRLRAREGGERLEDQLTRQSSLDPLQVMNVFAEIQVARPTCLRCLLPLESGGVCDAEAAAPPAPPPDEAVARAVLATASSLHVLEPTDLLGHHDRPTLRLEELTAEGLLDELVLDALELLLERKAPQVFVAESFGDNPTLSPAIGAGPAPSGSQTISPARSGDLAPPTAEYDRKALTSRHRPAPRLDPDDLDALPPEPRATLAGAAFARLLLRDGALTRRELTPLRARARAESSRLEDILVAEGISDAVTAMSLFAEAQVTRPTCLRCLQPLSSGANCDPTAPPEPERPVRLSSGTLAGPGGQLPPAPSVPSVGGRLGDYELLERIGEGGMGIVFRARDRALNRGVALKIMRAGPLASPLRRARFLQEAESAAALHHRNIVPIHQIGEIQGYPYYTMDIVDGTTIDAYVRAHDTPPAEIASLIRQVADGVHHFHTRGIIHRDLKPDNVLVNAEGVPQIIDFGIAKKVTGENSRSWTVEGDLMGTPHYMSPEQAAGRNQDVDVRSDVYAVGTILYELLAGQPPFAGTPQRRVIEAIQDEEPRSLRSLKPDLDTDLRAIVGMAMAKERDRRYGSAFELTQDLERYVANQPVRARPATVRYRLRKFVRRHRRGVALAGFVAAAAISVAAYLVDRERAHRAHIEALLTAASEAPLEERSHLYSRVLGLVPNHQVARLQRQAAERELDQRRTAAERSRLDAERVKRERAQMRVQQLERERQLAKARAAVEAIEARQRAREEARKQARRAAERRSQALLTRARRERDRLKQIALLDQAVLLVREFKSPLRREVERAKLQSVLALARRAVATEKVGLAEYWLHQATALSPKALGRTGLDEVRAMVLDLRSGKQLHESARRFIRKQDWLGARQKLLQARARGYEPVLVRQDLALVQRHCRARGQRLLSQAQASLRADQPIEALAHVRDALRYLPDHEQEQARVLKAECAEAAARAAQLRCLASLEDPTRAANALGRLDRAARQLAGTAAGRLLEREVAQRTRLAREQAGDRLVYVPALRGRAAFVIQRKEVTNAEFAAFVQARGYQDPTLFDAAARPLLPTFVDATGRPGPRTWRDGGFGDVRNGGRPVRGVTYYEARAFARWRSRTTHRRWRLPSRAEWETAAGWDPRERRLRKYPWGARYRTQLTHALAGQPLPVGSVPFDRSPLGLLDAAGSVCEWVEESKGGRPTPRLKGSRYAADPREGAHTARVRASGRPGPTPPLELTEWIGFRLVREETP